LSLEAHRQNRAIGARFAAELRQRQWTLSSSADIQAIQAIASDLVGERVELLPPLKYLISAPKFQRLINKVGNGRESIELQALLAGMDSIFSSNILQAIEEILCGFLDLPETSSRTSESGKSEFDINPKTSEEPTTSSSVARSPLMVGNHEINPSAYIRDIGGNGIVRSVGVFAIAMLLGVILAAATNFVRSTSRYRCPPFELCEPNHNLYAQQSLDAADKAVRDLEMAVTLEGYRDSAHVLGRELLKLSGISLTSQQIKRLELLSAFNQKVQAALGEEETAQELLKRAREKTNAAVELNGPDRQEQVEKIRQLLSRIPPRSFSFRPAQELIQKLDKLEEQRDPKRPNELRENPLF